MTLWRRQILQSLWIIVGFAYLTYGSLAQSQASSSGSSERQAATNQSAESATSLPQSADLSELPDSPGAIVGGDRTQQTGSASSGSQSEVDIQVVEPQSAPASPQSGTPGTSPQRPVGTAAAEAHKTSGVAASQPAGVAIAPAKQHRVRTIVLKTGAIIAAGAALGAVVALTAATPSKPPGAR